MISTHLSNFNTQMEFRDQASLVLIHSSSQQTFEKLSHEIQMDSAAARTIHIRWQQPQKPV